MYVYHFKSAAMTGNMLLPLNTLRESLPGVYAEEVKKYQGRELLLEKELPFLNCLWNDVIHLSPINPQLMLDATRSNNLPEFVTDNATYEVYRIPIAYLSEKDTLCFQSFNFDFKDFLPELEKFWRFSAAGYRELTAVPEKQIEIWKRDTAAGRRPFWYSHTLHILSRTTIDISDCEILVCE